MKNAVFFGLGIVLTYAVTRRLVSAQGALVAALLFVCVSIPLTRLADHLLAKERRRTSGTAVR